MKIHDAEALFSPESHEERAVHALENLRFDFQELVAERLKHLAWSRADLAERIGVTPARVTAILSDKANLTLSVIASVLAAVDVDACLSRRQRAELSAVPSVKASAWKDFRLPASTEPKYQPGAVKQLNEDAPAA
jgi:transcriptional regulator with XRE-family HTH domain